MRALTRRDLLAAAGVAVTGALAGCTGTQSPSPNETTGAAPEMSTTPTPTTDAGSNVLLVYFSRPGENYWEGGRRDLEVGNTKVLAQIIAERVECDEHEIQAADPYPEAYDPTVERNRQEQADDARPAIAGDLPDVSGYDIVLLGCPVWNSSAPMIMHTLLESIDLAGKTVLPFVTYAISGMSGIDAEFREALPESEVRDGLAVRGEDAADAAAAVEQWLGANGLG